MVVGLGISGGDGKEKHVAGPEKERRALNTRSGESNRLLQNAPPRRSGQAPVFVQVQFARASRAAVHHGRAMSPTVPPGTVSAFLRELRTTGAPVVRLRGAGELHDCLRHIEAGAAADAGLIPLLREWHTEALEELAGPPLPFDEPAARWGAQMLFRAAWFYLHRDAAESQVVTLLADPLPGGPSAQVMFSADLALQYLPGLHRLARTLAPGDPLLGALQRMAEALPLSGAGIEPEEGRVRQPQAAAWQAVRAHPGLWRMFTDRVIAANARWWLGREEVKEAVRRAAGAFAGELVPAFDLSDSVPDTHDVIHS